MLISTFALKMIDDRYKFTQEHFEAISEQGKKILRQFQNKGRKFEAISIQRKKWENQLKLLKTNSADGLLSNVFTSDINVYKWYQC